MIAKYFHTIRKLILQSRNAGKIERGAIFVVVILIMLIFAGYILVGGTLPAKIPDLGNGQLEYVAVNPPKNEIAKNNLQLYTFTGATLTPYPTINPAAPTPATKIAMTNVSCGKTVVGREEPEIIWATRIAATPASNNQVALQIFYADEHTLPLGIAMTKPPADMINNPPLDAKRDGNKFPIPPAVFLTDISTNPTDTSGDAQSGGLAQGATRVYGGWKVIGGPDPKALNGVNLGAGADAWPAANGPAGGDGRDLSTTAQIVWDLSSLKTKDGQPLQPGKLYRIQIAVHDGDATPGISQLCATFTMPSTGANPAPGGPVGPGTANLSKGAVWELRPFIEQDNWAGIEQDATDMQTAGIKWTRTWIGCTSSNATWDRLLDILQPRGISLLADINCGNDIGSAADRASYKSWLAGFVNRYKARGVHYYEIGNEPNLGDYWNQSGGPASSVSRYLQRMEDAYTTIHANDPQAFVIYGGVSEWESEPYIDQLVAQQAWRFMDGMAFHPYSSNVEGNIARLNMLKGKMAQNPTFASKPIWITEVGYWSTNLNPGGQAGYINDQNARGQVLVSLMNALKGWGLTTPVFWYILHEPSYGGGGYGLTNLTSGTAREYYPAFQSYKNYNF